MQVSQSSSSTQSSDLGFTCDERNNSYSVGNFNMDRIGVFHYSFKRSPIIMETCGNVSLLRINVNVLLRQEGKFGMENKYFRMNFFMICWKVIREYASTHTFKSFLVMELWLELQTLVYAKIIRRVKIRSIETGTARRRRKIWSLQWQWNSTKRTLSQGKGHVNPWEVYILQ